ncbi:TRAP transporter large permease [Minwuia thermotolerans]|uniref:C4-dicarboxylate ABC transporter permease n=1 Tax=Minwuia thermotolerans TaxID=2056226 RepID=A0A2M9FYZ2_9PROT|nr:TRAP transporter large permease subunit [Minwuia thermotolerans]PJK28670.1 C4-dicarboxylate ABC transporter permease [Minwuia thermotolerans]
MELFFLAVLVLIMAFALGSGYPVAFALPGAAILSIGLAAATGYLFAGNMDAYFHSGGPSQWLSAGVTNLRGVYWEVERDTLIAIPLFIFMGIMLQRSKIAEDLLVTMAQLFGPVPGGLGISVVFVGALLAATTGIVGATVVAMGLISLPAMLRNNYSPSLATGTIAASGTLGQIIPPSIVLIILADQLASATDQAGTLRKELYKEATGELTMPSVFGVSSTSAGEMFLGAFVPGLVLVGLYMAYILIFAVLRPKNAPAIHSGEKFDAAFWRKVILTLVPPLALIFLVLGSIITGIATVNQAGAIGAAGALIMAGYRLSDSGKMTYAPAIMALAALGIIGFALANFEMNVKAVDTADDSLGIAIGAVGAVMLIVALIWSGVRVLRIENTLQGVMLETAKTTSLVFIILLGAAMLTAAFRAFGGEDLVRDFLNSLPGGFWTQFIIVMAVIFILGFFLDFIEIAVVVVPIVAPILLADPEANITAVWLGVMIGLNIQTSFLTPPFGFALFYLRGVAPAVVKTVQMYKGVIAFISLQLIALGIVGAYPPLVNYLPSRVSFLSDTSPPPRNPKLQFCLEEYVARQIERDPSIAQAIQRAQGLDLSPLPRDLARRFDGAVDSAATALPALEAAFEAEAAVEASADDYRPMLQQVRRIQKDVRELRDEADTLQTQINRLSDEATPERRRELEQRLDALLAEVERLQGEIPSEWKQVYGEFSKLTKAEDDARNTYRRAADKAYEDAASVLAVLDANEAFGALRDDLDALPAVIETAEPEVAMERIEEVERAFRDVAGADEVKDLLYKAKRELRARRGNEPDRAAALELHQQAVAAFEQQAGWRDTAEKALRDEIAAYLDAIEGTLGARTQTQLSRDQALFMASCNASHRDFSLHF